MSSDWLSLFVHQGKEFIDSVSPRKNNEKDENITSESGSQLSSMATVDEVSERFDSETSTKKQDISAGKAESEAEVSSQRSTVSKESLSGAEKNIYETQLEQLQEQLVDIMIQNQEMESELSSLRDSDVSKLSKELEKEKLKRRQLEEKLKKTNDDGTPKLRRRKKRVKDDSGVPINEAANDMTEEHEIVGERTTSLQSEPEEPLSQEPRSRFQRTKSLLYSWYLAFSQKITLFIWDVVADLSDEETPLEPEDADGAPLTVKTLRENIRRFGSGIKPITEFFKKVDWVLSWRNPAATMLVFLVYVFSFWHGYTTSLLIFLVIVQLSANFVYSRFGGVSAGDVTESTAEPAASWSDRFQIVLHVARKVQNVLGYLSDNLEKVKNLFMWKVTNVTFKLYVVLWVLLVVSLALTGPQFFTLLGIALGYKLFIQSPIYKRFPKLRRKYDATLRLWEELPVGNEPESEGTANEMEGQAAVSAQSSSLPVEDINTINSQLFCQRYKLTTDEVLIRGWEEGWRTSLMNKNKPLVNIKHGRLYLTQHYLCFERSKTNVEKNVLLKLIDIRSVNKYKPLFILPGTGMSLEVCVKDRDEPYIFAAILGRDDAYNDIIRTAKDAGLAWAV